MRRFMPPHKRDDSCTNNKRGDLHLLAVQWMSIHTQLGHTKDRVEHNSNYTQTRAKLTQHQYLVRDFSAQRRLHDSR